MDTSLLRVFHAVAETGSVAAAAEHLHCVRSNISARLKALEEDLGTTLFVRGARGMTLNPAGKLLLDYTRRILALTDEARIVLRNSAGEGGSLRIASTATAAATQLPPLLAAFHEQCPSTLVTLSTASSEQNMVTIRSNAADMALVAGPVTDPLLTGLPMFLDELVLVKSATSAQSASDTCRTLLVLSTGCMFRARMLKWITRKNIMKPVIMEFGTLEGLLGCVVAGMGVTLLPKTVVDKPQYKDMLVTVDIDPDIAKVETWLVYRKDALLTEAHEHFLSLARTFGHSE